MGIDWKLIIELYPNAVRKVNENIGEWEGDPQITSEGIIDNKGNKIIPDFLKFALEDLGVDVTKSNSCITPQEYNVFYTNAFKELN